MRLLAPLVVLLAFSLVPPPVTLAQDVPPELPVPVDTVQVESDTLLIDDVVLPEAPAPARGAQPGGLSGAVTFSARDSIVIVIDEDDEDIASLFGTANVSYGDAQLEA